MLSYHQKEAPQCLKEHDLPAPDEDEIDLPAPDEDELALRNAKNAFFSLRRKHASLPWFPVFLKKQAAVYTLEVGRIECILKSSRVFLSRVSKTTGNPCSWRGAEKLLIFGVLEQ